MHCKACQKIALQIRAQLENITNLTPDGEEFRWYLKLKCLNCGEETKEYIYLTLTENTPLKGGRGHASLVLKCKLCSRENSIDIMRETIASYNAENTNNFKTMVVYDCRGVEPSSFDARAGWKAEGAESGTPFTEINLQEKEWCDYDEKAAESVGLYELEHKFITTK